MILVGNGENLAGETGRLILTPPPPLAGIGRAKPQREWAVVGEIPTREWVGLQIDR